MHPHIPDDLLQELLDNEGELKRGPINTIGVWRLAMALKNWKDEAERLAAENESMKSLLFQAADRHNPLGEALVSCCCDTCEWTRRHRR